jgi:hypothetical protein
MARDAMSDIMDADTATAETVSKPQSSWRDHLKVHPAAELFPLMSESELRELGKDIKKHGLKSQIVLWKDNRSITYLLDGRNRLDAAGKNVVGADGFLTVPWRYHEGDPYDLVVSFNMNRRHLTEEQRREVIAKIIKAKPEASDRAIAKTVKRDHKVVARVRKKMERTGAVAPVERRLGADGKQRKKPAKKVETDEERRDREECVALFQKAADAERELAQHKASIEHRATGSTEVSIEDRRARYRPIT